MNTMKAEIATPIKPMDVQQKAVRYIPIKPEFRSETVSRSLRVAAYPPQTAFAYNEFWRPLNSEFISEVSEKVRVDLGRPSMWKI
jgi:hypothetical protein